MRGSTPPPPRPRTASRLLAHPLLAHPAPDPRPVATVAVKAIGAAQEYVSDAGTSLKFTAALVDRENPALRGEVKSTFTLLTVMATS